MTPKQEEVLYTKVERVGCILSQIEGLLWIVTERLSNGESVRTLPRSAISLVEIASQEMNAMEGMLQ